MPGPHRAGVDPRVKPWDDGARGGLCGKPARQSLRRAHTIKERYRRNRRHHLWIQSSQLGFTVLVNDRPRGDQAKDCECRTSVKSSLLDQADAQNTTPLRLRISKTPPHPPSSQALSLGSMPGLHRSGVDPRVKPWDDGARGGLWGKPALQRWRESLLRAHTIKERYRRNRRHHLWIQSSSLDLRYW
ncbi:UNVERIFIED_ORG: hypothetical protein GGE44_000590 [Rhizobium esperanzae]